MITTNAPQQISLLFFINLGQFVIILTICIWNDKGSILFIQISEFLVLLHGLIIFIERLSMNIVNQIKLYLFLLFRLVLSITRDLLAMNFGRASQRTNALLPYHIDIY